MRASRPLLVVLLLCSLAGVPARPDCNACFMKRVTDAADRDTTAPPPATTTTTTQQQQQSVVQRMAEGTAIGEATDANKRGHRAGARGPSWPGLPGRAKRTVRGRDTAAGWQQEIWDRLRDVLVEENAERMKMPMESTPGQWWEDAPTDSAALLTKSEAARPGPEARAERGRWGKVKFDSSLGVSFPS